MPASGSRFAGDWLDRRERVDHLSRTHGLTALAAADLHRRGDERHTVIDLGAGRGSNLRYLAPRLPGPIDWRLLDHDAELLDIAVRQPASAGRAGDRITTVKCDLAASLAPHLTEADLVTASALIDLVSAEWVDGLIAACAASGAAVLVALSVDGRIVFSDRDSDDDRVCRAVRRDQQRDKGLGRALGGAAPAALINALANAGYGVETGASDWHLDRRDMPLVRPLIEGWREAAARQCPGESDIFAAWAARRRRAVESGAARLCVGHVDVLGLPNRRSRQSR